MLPSVATILARLVSVPRATGASLEPKTRGAHAHLGRRLLAREIDDGEADPGKSWRPLASRSVDLPMPGSPPTRTAEPGTRPPPSTRSNSAMPVGSRGASCRCRRPASRRAASRAFAAFDGDERGRAGRRAVSSMMRIPLAARGAFAGPAGGLPRRRPGRRRLARCFGHGRDLAADIAPEGARAEIGEHLVVDGAGVMGQGLRGTLGPDQLDPGAAPGDASGTSVTSTVIRSIETRPRIGAACAPR